MLRHPPPLAVFPAALQECAHPPPLLLPAVQSWERATLSQFYMYAPAYCSVLTGTRLPPPAQLSGPVEEANCDMATYVNSVHAVERTANFSGFEDGCQSAITALIRSGKKFGPPSAFERFVVLCRTCAKYDSVWSPVAAAAACDCYSFGLNRCPHWNPVDMMCAATGVCANQTVYWNQNCAISACGSTAVDEASWRKCAGFSILAKFDVAVAVFATLFTALWTAVRF